MPKLTIDGREVEVEPGQTVMNGAEKLGIEIPRFCYHPKLPIAGNCRMCLVEIDKMPKLTTSCTTPVTEGMVVHTKSEKVKDAQRVVLEFLLVNHPIDCPICDKAGECPLQDQYYAFSGEPSRMHDEKVHKGKRVDLGPTIVLDQERCVLCTRCIRFMEHHADDYSLGIVNRGDHAELTVFPGRPLDNVYSMNTVDVCPVGALTAKDFRFKKRVWYLKKTESVCTFCANGCNTVVEHDEGVVHRIRPRINEDVNSWWMCDTGRLEYHFVNSQDRVKCCLVRESAGEQVRAGWQETLALLAGKLRAAGGRAGGIASPQMTNEGLYAFGRFFNEVLASTRFGFVKGPTGPIEGEPADDFLIKADKNPNSRGAEEILGAMGMREDAVDGLLASAEQGKLPALIVFDSMLLDRIEDRDRWRRALEKVELLVVAGTLENELTRMAHVVLPLAAWVEEEGTYTRFDGRVQRARRAFKPMAEARDSVAIFARLSTELGKSPGPALPEAVFKELARKVSFYDGLSYAAIGKLGAVGRLDRSSAKHTDGSPQPTTGAAGNG